MVTDIAAQPLTPTLSPQERGEGEEGGAARGQRWGVPHRGEGEEGGAACGQRSEVQEREGGCIRHRAPAPSTRCCGERVGVRGSFNGTRDYGDLSPTIMAVTPPSTNSMVPAMKSESSDTRKRTAR